MNYNEILDALGKTDIYVIDQILKGGSNTSSRSRGSSSSSARFSSKSGSSASDQNISKINSNTNNNNNNEVIFKIETNRNANLLLAYYAQWFV